MTPGAELRRASTKHLDGLAGAAVRLRQLRGYTSVSSLLAATADMARSAGGFDRVIALAVDAEHLSAKACGSLSDEPSDLLRRSLLRTPIPIDQQSREGRWLRVGLDTPAPAKPAPSALDHLGLGYLAVGPIAPESDLLAVVVACKQTPISDLEFATVEGIAEVAAVALSRLVMTARLREATDALRSLSVSTEGLIEEVLRAPIQIPSEGAAGPMFPVAVRPVRDVNLARDVLTDREIEVASLLVDGKSDREIAAALVISVNTAKDHVARIRRKLQAANRVEAAAKYLRLTHHR